VQGALTLRCPAVLGRLGGIQRGADARPLPPVLQDDRR